MHNASPLTGSLSTKSKFLDKYISISKTIRLNSSCYVVSSEWWTIFESLISPSNNELETPMENPGPINNLPLLDMSEIYREIAGISEDMDIPASVDGQVLAEMTDWDNMSLKQNLKYKADFVIISSFLWKFLQDQFQGGPEIELIPELKPEGNVFNMITSEDGCCLDKNIAVNMELIKVYLCKDEEFDSAAARYISPTVTVQGFLNFICKEYYMPPHKAVLRHRNKQNKSIELKDKKATLASFGVQNGSYLAVSREIEDLYGYPSVSGNRESIWEREEAIENSDSRSERRRRAPIMQDSDFEGNFSTNSRDATDSARMSTEGSTNPYLNPLDFSEYMLGDGDLPGTNARQRRTGFMEFKEDEYEGMNSQRSKHDIANLKDQNYPDLETFLKRSHQSSEKQKIRLKYKSLQEIKKNVAQIQHEWNLLTGSNLNKKA